MSEPAAGQIGQAPGAAAGPSPSLASLFGTFLMLGTTSIGGGVVAYLRATLVGKRAWLDDVTFVELLSISQTMPGLNAVNMSILVGDRLRGGRAGLLRLAAARRPARPAADHRRQSSDGRGR